MPIKKRLRLFHLLVCCLALLLGGWRIAHGQSLPSETVPVQTTPEAPVTLNGKVIFQVRGILSFPAQARAEAITNRVTDLSKEVAFDPKSLSVANAEGTSDIMAGDLVLMSVTDQDASLAGKPRPTLAREYADRIGVSLVALRKEYSAKSLTLGGAYTLAATIVLIVIFRILGMLFPRLYRLLDTSRGTRIPSVRIQQFELLTADRIADIVMGIAKLLRFALVLVVLYFYVSLVLGFFPWTRNYAHVLFGYILSPLDVIWETVVAYLPNVFFIAVIVIVAVYVTKLARIFFVELEKGSIVFDGFHTEWAAPTYKIVRFMIMAVTAIAIFPYLPGSKSPAFQGISIFLGVLLSLGSSSAVANIVAGVILTYMRAFKLGDRVQIADTVGDVIEVSLLVTRIRTIKNVEITIANSMVLSSHIINFSGSVKDEGLILNTTVTIGYDAPWRTIHQLLIDAAKATENILATPAPFVFQTALDDFYVHYQINAYTDQPNRMAKTYSDLHQHIQDKFYEAGVEIMSPHFATVRDGNHVAIPDQYLAKDYKAPSFRVTLDGPPGKANNQGVSK